MKLSKKQQRVLGELEKILKRKYAKGRKREADAMNHTYFSSQPSKADSDAEMLAGEYAHVADFGLDCLRELKGVFKYL
jgi:hypothetical protein